MKLELLKTAEPVESVDLHVTLERAREIVNEIDGLLAASPGAHSVRLVATPENAKLTLSHDEAAELRDSLQALLDDPRPERHEHVSSPDYDREVTVWLRL